MSRSMEVRKRVGPIMERMKKSLIKIQDLEDSLLRQDGRQHHDDADKSATTMTKHACVDDCASSCSTLTAASVGLPLAVISEDEPLTEAQQRMALSKRQSSSSSMSSSLSSSLSSAASVSSTSGASAGSPKRSRSNRSRSSNDSKPPKTKLSKRDALMKRSMEMLRNKMSQLQQMEMCILEAEDRTIQLNQMVVHQSQMVDQHAICKIELTQARDVQEELLHKLERASDHHERLMEFKQSRIDDLERQVQMLTARLKALGTVESDLKISIKFQRRLQHQLQERQELVDKQTKRADDLQLQVEILTNQCKLHQQQLVKEYAINAQHRQATNKPRSLHSRNNSNIRNNDDDDELLLHQPYPLTMQIDNMSNLSDTSIETPFSGSSYQQTGLTPESSQKANQTTTIKNTKSSRRNLRSMFGGSRRNKAKQKKKATTMTVESTTATTVNNATASSKTPVAEKRRCVSPQNTPPITPHTTPEKVTPEKTPVVVQHHQPAVPIVTTSFDHSDVSHLTADEPETALSDTSLSDNQQLVDVVQQPRQEVSTSQTETLKENDNATSIPQQQHEELKVEKTTTDGATPQEQPQESKKTDQVTPQEQQEQQEPQQEPQQEMTDEVSPQEQPQQEPKEDDKAISNPEPTTTVDEVMPEQQPKPEKQKKNQPSFFRQLMQTTDAYQLKKLLEQK